MYTENKKNKDEKENDIDLTAERLKLLESTNEFIKINKIKLTEDDKLSPFKKREKKIVCKTFTGFGLVVPLINNIGYREIGYTISELKKIFKRMNNDKKNNKKINAEEMEIILTNVCLADDEGDPGMGYELGINFFYSYPMFQSRAKRLLVNAYNLTNRNSFIDILNAHFNVRGKQHGKNYCNQLLNKKKKHINNKKDDNKKKPVPKSKKITNFFQKTKKNDNNDNNKNQNKNKNTQIKNTLDELSSDSDE